MSEYSNLIKAIRNMKETLHFDSFKSEVRKTGVLSGVIDVIETISEKWAIGVGLRKAAPDKKNEEPCLSAKELQWKMFFQDHSFRSMEDARTLSDFASLVTGIDTNRFIQSKGKTGFFAPLVCIVPTGNPNSHNYVEGLSILSIDGGAKFLRHDCEYGNSMTQELSCIRLADRNEIEQLLCSIFYRSGSVMERILSIVEGEEE